MIKKEVTCFGTSLEQINLGLHLQSMYSKKREL